VSGTGAHDSDRRDRETCPPTIMDTIDDADVDGDIMEAQELGQQLIDAILEGAPSEDIHALVDAHAPLWYQAPDGTSALHAAAYAGDAALIKLLIDKGAIWNASACPRFLPDPTAADHAQWTTCRTRRATSRSR
jgi:ankyrin repeat protein